MNKVEVQEKIVKTDNDKATDDEFSGVLKMVAPGTNLRTALDGILKAKKGAIIAIENNSLLPLIEGGFRINSRFTPQRLIELSKMDGALILSKDMKKINYANVLLTPDNKIKSSETGTRHKAAERTAKQTATLVIAISERKNVITLFYKNMKYLLVDTEVIFGKTNEHIKMLENQRESFNKLIETLTYLELTNQESLNQAIQVMQKGMLIQKVSKNLRRDIIELGREGELMKVRLKEILQGIEKETDFIIKDYSQLNLKKSKFLLDSLNYEEIINRDHIASALDITDKNEKILAKGWRILSRTCLSDSEIAQLINQNGSLGKIIHSNLNNHSGIIAKEKLETFKEEVNKIKMNL